ANPTGRRASTAAGAAEPAGTPDAERPEPRSTAAGIMASALSAPPVCGWSGISHGPRSPARVPALGAWEHDHPCGLVRAHLQLLARAHPASRADASRADDRRAVRGRSEERRVGKGGRSVWAR